MGRRSVRPQLVEHYDYWYKCSTNTRLGNTGGTRPHMVATSAMEEHRENTKVGATHIRANTLNDGDMVLNLC